MAHVHLPGKASAMSRTDKDRPYYIRAYDPLDRTYIRGVEHSATLHGEGMCDAHVPDSQRAQWSTSCRAHASTAPLSFAAHRVRNRVKKTRQRQLRTTDRDTARTLVRAANSGDVEACEDLIDRRRVRLLYSCGCCF